MTSVSRWDVPEFRRALFPNLYAVISLHGNGNKTLRFPVVIWICQAHAFQALTTPANKHTYRAHSVRRKITGTGGRRGWGMVLMLGLWSRLNALMHYEPGWLFLQQWLIPAVYSLQMLHRTVFLPNQNQTMTFYLFQCTVSTDRSCYTCGKMFSIHAFLHSFPKINLSTITDEVSPQLVRKFLKSWRKKTV